MARLVQTGSTTSSVTVQIIELQWSVSLYNFRFKIGNSSYVSSSSSSYTFTTNEFGIQLVCGVGYSVTGEAEYPKSSGNWFAFSTTATTSACPPSPPNTPSGSVSAGNQSATVTALFDSTATRVDAFISPTTRQISSSGGSTTFTGLNNGQTYTPFIRSYNSSTGLYSSWVQLNNVTPTAPITPSPPTITSVTSTTTTITTFVQFGANTDHVNVFIPQATVPTLKLYSNGSVTHTGLSPNTLYTVFYQAWNADETIGSGSQSFTKLTAGARPVNWSWNFTVASGQPCVVPASQWIGFQNRINEFRVYKGLANYGFTTGSFVVTGQPFLAFLANQAVNAISDMSPPTSPPSTVSSLQVFTASWLNQLTNSLNSIV